MEAMHIYSRIHFLNNLDDNYCTNFHYYSDEDLPVNFFPSTKDKAVKQELTDTFSIEEMDMSPDEDEDLNLEPPKQIKRHWCCLQVPADWKCQILWTIDCE